MHSYCRHIAAAHVYNTHIKKATLIADGDGSLVAQVEPYHPVPDVGQYLIATHSALVDLKEAWT